MQRATDLVLELPCLPLKIQVERKTILIAIQRLIIKLMDLIAGQVAIPDPDFVNVSIPASIYPAILATDGEIKVEFTGSYLVMTR